MNVETIEMDPAEARAASAEYAAILRRGFDAEYAAVRDGLDALGRGEKVIAAGAAIAAAPRDDAGRPLLAIARADRKEVRFRWRSSDRAAGFSTAHPNAPVATDTLDLTVDMGAAHGRRDGHGYGTTIQGFALVPLVPPAGLRVIGGRSQLCRAFVLWEVEQWADSRRTAKPDRDPYLLRHLGGDLYSVLYEWDLTELERAVMYGRRAAT